MSEVERAQPRGALPVSLGAALTVGSGCYIGEKALNLETQVFDCALHRLRSRKHNFCGRARCDCGVCNLAEYGDNLACFLCGILNVIGNFQICRTLFLDRSCDGRCMCADLVNAFLD